MGPGMFDGLIEEILLVGAVLGSIATIVLLYVVPYLWHHIAWVR